MANFARINLTRIGRLAALTLAVLLGLGASAGWAQSDPKTLRFIPQADLRSIDPIWTTAYVTRNFGYLVFDTLFALDKDFKPQPQMVDTWKVSDDKLAWTFTLRPGLKWHDGTPVRAADCVASIERWGKRDPFGQKLADAYLDANLPLLRQRLYQGSVRLAMVLNQTFDQD